MSKLDEDHDTRRVMSKVTLERNLRASVSKAMKAFDKSLKNMAGKDGSDAVILNYSIKMMDTYFKYEIDKEKLVLKSGGTLSVEDKTPETTTVTETDTVVTETDTVKVLRRPG